jgi:hypothetical protein
LKNVLENIIKKPNLLADVWEYEVVLNERLKKLEEI